MIKTQRLKQSCCLWKLCSSTVFTKIPAKWYLAYVTLEAAASKASRQVENLPITSTTETVCTVLR